MYFPLSEQTGVLPSRWGLEVCSSPSPPPPHTPPSQGWQRGEGPQNASHPSKLGWGVPIQPHGPHEAGILLAKLHCSRARDLLHSLASTDPQNNTSPDALSMSHNLFPRLAGSWTDWELSEKGEESRQPARCSSSSAVTAGKA